MTKPKEQQIIGNNNIQVGGDYITTNKVVKKTEIIYDKDVHITDAQAKEIRDKVHKIAESRSGESRYSYGQAFKSLYDKFHITKYELLPIGRYEEAIKWLDKQIAINRPKLRNVNNEQFRKDMYKAIHARARQLGVDIHEFATNALSLKSSLKSLSDLSDMRLKQLYTKIFSIRYHSCCV